MKADVSQLDDLPAGTVLAPEESAVVLPRITSKLRPTNFRSFDAPWQMILVGRPDNADALTKAAATAEHLAAFKKVIGWGLDYVVLGSDMSNQRSAVTTLTDASYRERKFGISNHRLIEHGAPDNRVAVLPIGARYDA